MRYFQKKPQADELMDGIICDRCGRDLLGEDIRYTMRMENREN